MLPSLAAQLGISVVAALAAAWAGLRFLGATWLEKRFERSLEELKHRQSRQIEQVKHDLDLLRNRVAKLHDQEFIVLPEVWTAMAEAMSAILGASDPERLYPSALGMNEGELNEYLETAPLLSWEKGAIRSFPPDQQEQRDASLRVMLDWAGYRRARKLVETFQATLQGRRIFMSAELTAEVDRVAALLEQAVAEFRRFLEARQKGQRIELEVCPRLKRESARMADAVQAEIQRKLYPKSDTGAGEA